LKIGEAKSPAIRTCINFRPLTINLLNYQIR
jgi:hypothetical protein